MTGAGPSGGARAIPHAASLWDDETPVGTLGQLVYRARLLATNPAITHRRCGSVSVKGTAGGAHEHEALWIGGAGRDLLTLDVTDLAGVDLRRLLPLQESATRTGEVTADQLDTCRLAQMPVAPPADALLHAFVAATHVDRTSPDAIAILCCAANGEQLAHTCFGDELAWIPYTPPGFLLAHAVARAAAAPGVRLVLIAHQGLVTWGETSDACYARTLEAANRAADFVSTHTHGPRFGGPAVTPLSEARRAALLTEVLPVLRDALAGDVPQVLQVDTSPRVQELVCSRDGAVLTQAGAASAVHVPHTGLVPLWIDFDPWHDDADALSERIARGTARHRALVGAVVDAVGPHVVLIESVGMVTAGATAAQAQLARDVYHRTIEAIAGASSIDVFTPLPIIAEPPI